MDERGGGLKHRKWNVWLPAPRKKRRRKKLNTGNFKKKGRGGKSARLLQGTRLNLIFGG